MRLAIWISALYCTSALGSTLEMLPYDAESFVAATMGFHHVVIDQEQRNDTSSGYGLHLKGGVGFTLKDSSLTVGPSVSLGKFIIADSNEFSSFDTHHIGFGVFANLAVSDDLKLTNLLSYGAGRAVPKECIILSGTGEPLKPDSCNFDLLKIGYEMKLSYRTAQQLIPHAGLELSHSFLSPDFNIPGADKSYFKTIKVRSLGILIGASYIIP